MPVVHVPNQPSTEKSLEVLSKSDGFVRTMHHVRSVVQRQVSRLWTSAMVLAVLVVQCATVTENVPAARPEPTENQTKVVTADVVIYGGTSAAVAAAVQVKKMSKSVVIVSPDKHLGGLTSGGLGWTDTGNKSTIGGIARDFYHRVWQHYDRADGWRWQSKESYGSKGMGSRAADGKSRTMWIFEPHVAEQIFDELVDEYDIAVHRNEWLDRESGVDVIDGKIREIGTLSGHAYRGRVFLDATYEGDLMAAAGVSYHVGRESSAQYGEEYNGVQTGVLHHHHHFDVLPKRVDPYVIPGDPSSGVIPRVSAEPPGEFGAADDKVQAYCFRMCLTDHPENRVPFAKPDGYDPAQYELMARTFAAGWREVFRKFDPIPNRKTDTNNHGPMSSDNIGFNYDYPNASYERRAEIIREHETYQKGWLYFVANDPRVPADVQKEMQSWGLAADEFTDNGNWPHQIYVREARRMVGDFVMTENELRKRRPTPQSIGLGSYAMDSHNVQRYITPEGYVQNEGDIGASTHGPYEIAFGAILPKKAECQNLLVPVCVSSSHIAFGSIRMEPVFMILGQSAATTAVMAIDNNGAVQDVSYEALKERLVADGQVLQAPAASKSAERKAIRTDSLPGVTVDDSKAEMAGAWTTSTSSTTFVGHGYRHDGDKRDGLASASFSAELASGQYEVRIAYPPNSNRTSKARFEITHADGRSTVVINQRKTPEIKNALVSAGVYRFDESKPAKVTVSNQGTDGYVVIDAVSWVKAE